jgi:beta-N-acetylhexosaminidase
MLGPLMVDLQGTELTSEEKDLIKHPLIGGLILFSRNYTDPAQLKELIRNIRSTREELLLAVDQEGGRVQRFQEGFSKLPPCLDFSKTYATSPDKGLSEAKHYGYIMAKEVLQQQLDFSFAPVLDVHRGCNEVIANRAFGETEDTVVHLAAAYMEGMRQAGMATVGKHFPGHGSVSLDSHLGLPVDEREYAQVLQSDMQPFISLHPKLQAIMPAHILFPTIDAEYPVGFSRHWLQDILRKQVGFSGAIISDDLSMGGATQQFDKVITRAELALEAGCDMVLICNQPQDVVDVLDHLHYDIRPESSHRLSVMRASKTH